ncbi:hypothetical protein BH23BAC1_BH23BAC1_23940 [soil metagenome]
MKKSDKLILGLFIVMVMGIFSTNMILKAEFDKINFKDIYHNYSQQSLTYFKNIRLEGSYGGLIQIQKGQETEIRILKGNVNHFHWEIVGDTLILIYNNDWKPYNYRTEDAFDLEPTAFIIAPELKSITAKGVNCKLTDWEEREWKLIHQGHNSGMFLSNNKIETLQADLKQGGLLSIGSKNSIKNANFQIQDTSSFVIEKDVFEVLNIRTDPKASIRIPGSLYQKLAMEK